MIVEPLPHERWDELRSFLLEFGEETLPEPMVKVSVLRDEGEIVGAYMSEAVVHIGPFYLRPELRENIAGGLLIRHAINNTDKEIHVVCMNSASEKACEKLGLERIEGTLWIREVKNNG